MSIRWLVPIAPASARRLVSPIPCSAKCPIALAKSAARPVGASLTVGSCRGALRGDGRQPGALEIDVRPYLLAQHECGDAGGPASHLELEGQPAAARPSAFDHVPADDAHARLPGLPGEHPTLVQLGDRPVSAGQPLLLDVRR